MRDTLRQMHPAIFYANDIYRGPRGGDASYYMQNVLEGGRRPRKSKHGTLTGAYSGKPVLTMVALEDFERAKYGKAQASRRAEQKDEEIKRAEWGAKLAHIIKQGQQALKSNLLTPTLSTLKNKWKYTFKDCHENLYTITAIFTPPATETQAINNIASVSCPEGFTILSVTQENQ